MIENPNLEALNRAGYNTKLLMELVEKYGRISLYPSRWKYIFDSTISSLKQKLEYEIPIQISYRFNADLLTGFILNINTLYFMDSKVRSLMQVNLVDCNDVAIREYPKHEDGFALSLSYQLTHLLNYAIKFGDYDLFIAYCNTYFNVVPEDYITELFTRSHVNESDVMILYKLSGGYKK
jgi:hypothetical protein